VAEWRAAAKWAEGAGVMAAKAAAGGAARLAGRASGRLGAVAKRNEEGRVS